MTEKHIKQLEKILAQESKLDQKKVEQAKAELKSMDKAYQKSIKV